MRRIATAVVVTALAIGVAGIAYGQGKTDPTLDKLAREFEAAFNAQDAAKLAAMYAEDAILMPPNHPMVKGRAAIEAFFKQDFKQGVTGVQLKPMESAVSDTQGFEAGTAVVTIKRTGGANVTDHGKYVVVFKRVGSDWKIAYDAFNSDQAPPPPTR
jgi:uncharacterized protein (TIGR02246 family)